MESVSASRRSSNSNVVFHQPREFKARVRKSNRVRSNLKDRLKAISLNNRGVTLLERCQYHAATDHLFEALQMCHKAILGEEEVVVAAADHDDHHSSSCCESTSGTKKNRSSSSSSVNNASKIQTNDVSLEDLMVKPTSATEVGTRRRNHDDTEDPTSGHKESPRSSSSDGGEGYMYQHPIFIPPSSTTRPLWLPSNTCLADIIIFNLAITTHSCALDENTTKTYEQKMFELDRAIRLYNMAYSLQLSQQRDMASPPSVLFVAAVVNNLCLAYEARGDIHMAHHCCEHLLSILMCNLISRRDNDRYDSVDDISRQLSSLDSTNSSDNIDFGRPPLGGFDEQDRSNRDEEDQDVLNCFLDNTMHLMLAKGSNDLTRIAPAA